MECMRLRLYLTTWHEDFAVYLRRMAKAGFGGEFRGCSSGHMRQETLLRKLTSSISTPEVVVGTGPSIQISQLSSYLGVTAPQNQP